MKMEALNLADDEYLLMMSELNLEDINRVCLTSSYFQNLICDNEDFWYSKFKKDFPAQAKVYNHLAEPLTSWKQVISHLNTIPYIYRKLFHEFTGIRLTEETSNLVDFPTLIASDKKVPESFLKLTQYPENFLVDYQISPGGPEQVSLESITELNNWLPRILDIIHQFDIKEIILKNRDSIVTQSLFS